MTTSFIEIPVVDLPESATTNKWIFVSQYGSDITGDGTYNKPVATTARAYAIIGNDASTTNRYSIHIKGTITEATIYLKPYCWFHGDSWGSSRLVASGGNIILHPTAYVSGNSRSGMTNVYLTGSTGISLDFVSVLATGSHVVELDHVGCNGSVVINPNNTNQYFQWEAGGLIFGNLTLHGALGLIFDLFIVGDVTINQAATPTDMGGINFQNCFFGNNFAVSTSGSKANPVQLTACTIYNTVTVTGTGATLFVDSVSLPLKALVTTATGGVITRTTDVFSVAYTPANGAHWTNPDPTNAQEAIDRIASLLYTLNSNTSIP